MVPVIVLTIFITPSGSTRCSTSSGRCRTRRSRRRSWPRRRRAGIDGGRVYEVDKSVDTKAVNAYVTGFGGTKRIVLWDTILQKLDNRELLFVMGHEMGHYVLHHVWRLIRMARRPSCSSLCGSSPIRWLISRYSGRFGFRR